MLLPLNLFGISARALTALIQNQLTAEMQRVRTAGVSLYYLPPGGLSKVAFWDFSRADSMIEEGRRAAEKFVAQEERATLSDL